MAWTSADDAAQAAMEFLDDWKRKGDVRTVWHYNHRAGTWFSFTGTYEDSKALPDE